MYNVGHILDDQPDAAVLFSDRFVQVFDEISEVRIIEEFPCLVEPEDFIFRGGFDQYFLGHEHNQIKYNFVDWFNIGYSFQFDNAHAQLGSEVEWIVLAVQQKRPFSFFAVLMQYEFERIEIEIFVI